MLSEFELRRFNNLLSERFGLLGEGRPLLRLSWTTDQTEILDGEHEVYSEAGIYLRTERGPRRVPKYPLVMNRYCIEKCEPAPKWLPEFEYTYEAFYFFQDKDGNYLEPIEEAVCAVGRAFLVERYPHVSEKLWREEAEAKERKTVEYFKEVLDDTYPWLVNQLHHGGAVGYSRGRHEHVGEHLPISDSGVQAGSVPESVQSGTGER